MAATKNPGIPPLHYSTRRYIIISLYHIASILLARVDVSVFPVLAGN
jgi:hypothetical protein